MDLVSVLYLVLYKCDRVSLWTVICLLDSVLWYILQALFDKGKNVSHVAEKVSSVYDPGAVAANHGRFRRFYSDNFIVKN